MTALDTRPVITGRRKTDPAPLPPQLPEWLHAPLLASEDPRDGSLIDPAAAVPGDYLLEFHESTGTASWLRILAPVAVVDGAALVTCGRGAGVTFSVPSDRQVWVLRRGEAAVLARSASDRVLRPYGGPDREVEALLRSFATRADVVEGWPDRVSLADAVTAWELLRTSDLANRTDAGRIATGAVAR